MPSTLCTDRKSQIAPWREEEHESFPRASRASHDTLEELSTRWGIMDAKVSHQFNYNANMKSILQVKDLLASKFCLLPDLKALDHKLSAIAWVIDPVIDTLVPCSVHRFLY